MTAGRPAAGSRDKLPLSGKRVLVTRAREQAADFSDLLRAQGAEPIEVSVLEIVPPDSYGELDGAIRGLDRYDWVVFTSANGVRAFLGRLVALGLDTHMLGGARLGAIGPATAAELRERQLEVDFVPDEYVAEDVAAGLIELGVQGKRVLLPQADLARDVLKTDLERAGAVVDAVVSYRTVPAREDLSKLVPDLAAGRIDVVTLGSSSTARNLIEGLGANSVELLSRSLIACIGPVTAKTAAELGLRVGVVAPEHTMHGMVEAIVRAVESDAQRSA